MPVAILADEKVNPEKGTGLVMCCTFGDKTDVEWYKKYKPLFSLYIEAIGRDGRMISHSPEIDLNGLTVAQGREKMVEALQAGGYIIDKKPIMHTVNVHERCKKEIEILMLPQWFLNLKDHKKTFIELADRINWYPSHMKSRYVNWVREYRLGFGASLANASMAFLFLFGIAKLAMKLFRQKLIGFRLTRKEILPWQMPKVRKLRNCSGY